MSFLYSPLNVGLVSFWNLDEASGTRVDTGPYTLSLTDNNSTANQSSINAQMNKAAAFVRASNQYLSISNTKLSFTAAVTICAWVNLASQAAGATYGIAGRQTTTNATSLEYGLQYVQSANRFSWKARVTGTLASVTANTFGAPSTSTWYFVVGIFDGSISSGVAAMKMSVNAGTFDTANTNASPVLNNPGTAPFLIGSEVNGTGTEVASFALDGAIDAVGVWNRVLTSDEISRLYANGNGRQQPNL